MENEIWTFDDLVYEAYWMLKKNPDILEKYRRNIEYLFMDECLPYHTPVLLADGSSKMIGEIVDKKLNVEVLAFNTQTGN
jgi:alpha-amylase/alpha-mannosidase (GH57 family)